MILYINMLKMINDNFMERSILIAGLIHDNKSVLIIYVITNLQHTK